MIEDERR